MIAFQQEAIFLDRARLLARLGFGGMMIPHGYSKMMDALGPGEIAFADPIGLGPEFSLFLTIFAELLCALFVVIGFKTRWASVPPIITMMVAAFVIHGNDPWNKKEFAMLFLVGFFLTFLMDSGKYSVDQLIKNLKKK